MGKEKIKRFTRFRVCVKRKLRGLGIIAEGPKTIETKKTLSLSAGVGGGNLRGNAV